MVRIIERFEAASSSRPAVRRTIAVIAHAAMVKATTEAGTIQSNRRRPSSTELRDSIP